MVEVVGGGALLLLPAPLGECDSRLLAQLFCCLLPRGR